MAKRKVKGEKAVKKTKTLTMKGNEIKKEVGIGAEKESTDGWDDVSDKGIA